MKISQERIILFSYFISIILIGSLLLVLPQSWSGEKPLAYVDALFTATSAVCVTGLITVDTALYSLFGKTVIMLLIQFGGLGIITWTTVYIALPRRKISLMNRSFIKDYYIEGVETNPRNIIKQILLLTLCLELVGALLLYRTFSSEHVPDAAFVSVFHAVSAFCNAGFSVFSTSLEAYVDNTNVTLTICALFVIGGIGFVVLQDCGNTLARKKKHLSLHSRITLVSTAGLITVGTLLFFVLEHDAGYGRLSVHGKVLAALFQAVTPRTAGFDTVNPANLTATSVVLTTLLMFIGGSSGSTAGGIKTSTFFILLLYVFKGTTKNNCINYHKNRISTETISKAAAVFIKATMIVLVVILLLTVTERSSMVGDHPARFLDIVFEVVSAFSTVGLTLGLTPNLSVAGKLIIVMTMFVGRVGLFTMNIPLRSNEIEKFVEYPDGEVMIG